MGYILRGRLCGYICDECEEPLRRVKVRLYSVGDGREVLVRAVANPKDTFALLSEDEARDKRERLIGEGETDDEGNYKVSLDEKNYDGGPLEVDVYCGEEPVGGVKPPNGPLQFTITTIQPMWRNVEQNDFVAVFSYCVPYHYWCRLLARLGLWVICGTLTTCKRPQLPIAGALVRAFDADWLQDDAIGADTTDANGHFTIYYTRQGFERTVFSPLINLEWTGGPDVYFKAYFGGNPILEEPASMGRTRGRENAGHCLCVHICTDKQPHTPPEKVPHWTKVWNRFNVQPDLFAPNDNFLPEGYAGSPAEAYVFGGSVPLNGNCPLKNVFAPTNSLKYRFLAAEWGYTAPGPRPGVMPTVSPLPAPTEPNATWKVVTGSAWVGDVYYNNGSNPNAKMAVNVGTDANGWIKLDGMVVTAPLVPSGTVNVQLSEDGPTANFVRSGFLLNMNTGPLTGSHSLPAWASDRRNAGRALTDAEKAVIRRFSVIFQVRDVGTDTDVFVEVRDSIIFDNSPALGMVNVEQLVGDACNEISGLTSINVRYTVDHPHLRYFHTRIKNNATDPVHAEGTMPGGDFAASAFFFRGGQSGPANPITDTGGFPVDISNDPACAYAYKLRYSTRHYLAGEPGDEALYCIDDEEMPEE